MPYNNEPQHLWGKMDRCVQDVMASEGVSKQRAIAICHASIVKEDDVTTARQKRKARRSAERRQAEVDVRGTNSDPMVLAALALADAPEGVKDILSADTAPEPEPPEVEGDEIGELLDEMDEEEQDTDEAAGKAVVAMVAPQEYDDELPFGGSTTWDALDAYMLMQDKVSNTRELTYMFETMVSNVMRSEEIPPEEKGDAIASLAVGFRTRVTTNFRGPKGLFEHLKAAMSGGKRNDLPDSAFAYIEGGGKKDEGGRTTPRSLRHYPIHDAAHVRNALSRAAAAIEAGGKTADVARRALPKIRAAAKRLGIGKPGEKKPNKKDLSGFNVFKGTDGIWRWVGWVTNKWRDRDVHAAPAVGGEILTSDAHADYVKWVDEDKENRAPHLWIWHTPGTERTKRADWVDYADGFVIASGELSEKEAGQLLALETMYDLGMSHGMAVLGRDEPGLITKYRSFEVSVLPRQYAANPWTAFSTIVKEVAEMGFNEEKRRALVAALGEEQVAALEAQTGDMAKALTTLGVDFKETTPEPAPAPEASKETPDPAPATAPEDEAVAKIVGYVIEGLQLNALNEHLKKQDERLEALEKGKQEASEAIAPKVPLPFLWANRPTASKENVVTSDPAGQTIEPTAGDPESWVSQVFPTIAPAQ